MSVSPSVSYTSKVFVVEFASEGECSTEGMAGIIGGNRQQECYALELRQKFAPFFIFGRGWTFEPQPFLTQR